VAVMALLAVVACGCGKLNAGASPQALPATTAAHAPSGCPANATGDTCATEHQVHIAPTTTTTVPPTTTTTIPSVSVPDAVSTTNTVGSVVAKQDITQAGLVPQVAYVDNSDACYFQDPLNGNTEWNAGAATSQTPAAGTGAPRGSTVTLYLCAGTPTIPIP
jgi:hypothetical protein